MNSTKRSTILGTLFLTIIIGFITMEVILLYAAAKFDYSLPTWLAMSITEMLVVAVSLIFMLFVRPVSLSELGFKKIKGRTVLWSLLLGFLSLPLLTVVNLISQFFVKNTLTQASDTLLSVSVPLLFFLMAIVPPVCEEFVFRGIFHRGYDNVTSVWFAILTSALLFGLMHLNINQLSYAFVIGILFAVTDKIADSIYPSIIMHMVINGINVVQLLLVNIITANAGVNQSVAELAESTRNNSALMVQMLIVYIPLAVICTGLCALVIYAIAKSEDRLDVLKSLNPKEKTATNEESRARAFSIPLIVAVVICIVYIFFAEQIFTAIGLQ